MPFNTLPTLLQAQAARYGDKPFLLFAEECEPARQTLSYDQLWQGCTQMAEAYTRLGIRHQDTVGILLPNIPEFLLAYWGAMTLGAIACPINTLLIGPEIAYIVNHCEARVLVTTPAFAAEINRIVPDCHKLQHLIVVEDADPTAEPADPIPWAVPYSIHSFSSLLSNSPLPLPSKEGRSLIPAPADERVRGDDIAQIIYTSGTTGKPKGVMLTHANLLANADMIRHWFDWTDATRLMCVLPLFHVNGEVVTMMTPLRMGGSVVLNRRFRASTFWSTLHQHQVSAFSCVPTILSILNEQGLPPCGVSESLILGICGAAPLPVEVHQRFETLFKTPIIEGYGLSETSCYSTFNPVSDLSQRKIGSIGLAVEATPGCPLGNQVAIWDANNLPVPDGTPGEVVVRGNNVMPGYFKNPEATEKAFAGGCFHTGDWGVRDPDGFFTLLDRVKDLIIRGGENISPREIDEVLYQHPAVLEAATIGVPDLKYGEEVKSYVVLRPDFVGSPLIHEQALLAFCAERLARFKQPKMIVFLCELPKGPTGKLLRRALRELGRLKRVRAEFDTETSIDFMRRFFLYYSSSFAQCRVSVVCF